MRILVADDNEFYRVMLEETLRSWGYDVCSAANGAQALEIISRKDAPKIALLDWVMPEMDGLEVCRRARELQRPEPTYLILLTVKEGKENHVAALQQGADDFLTKPCDHADLQARLQVARRTVDLQASLALRVRQLEDALSGAAKLEAIGRLAGGVAHDFNNMLTVILGCTELVMRDPLSAPMADHLKEICHAAERATHLTRQLLTFSRKQPSTRIALDLNELVGNFEKMLRRLIGEDVELELQLGAALPILEADPGQLEQVIMNLAVNARDAMPNGGRIIVETEYYPAARMRTERILGESIHLLPGKDYLRLSVKDNGHGMDEKTQALIFEPFFTTKPPGKGTGLGLATVYGIVKQHDGVVRVWSEQGRGTTFNLYFPVAAKAVEVPAQADLVVDAPRRGKETVLVVEDDAQVRHLAQGVLKSEGYEVIAATDGQAALELSQTFSGRIDLLLTDIVMPNLSGPELAEQLASSRPNTKVLFVSGYSDKMSQFLQSPVFASSFLPKPFSYHTLISKVRQVLDRS